MSMVRCEECDQIFSSDSDPECFVEVSNMRRMHRTMILCEPCRWEREEQRELQEHYESQDEADAQAIDTATEIYR